jgi:acetolactate synthase small subunit
MNETDEPRILFEQLEAIKELFEGAPIDIQEEEFIAVVMEKAPAKYASVIATMSVIKIDQLTLNVLFKVMSTFHRMEN